jgi:hypothetical protein
MSKKKDKAPGLPASTLVKDQKFTKTFHYFEDGEPRTLVVEVRHDDECGNGHNSFAITGNLFDRTKRIPGESSITHSSGKRLWLSSCGCLHDEIAKHAPEFAPFLKWHGTHTDEPLHYVANTTYHAGNSDPEAARACAIWPDATLEQLQDEKLLLARLPALMKEFKAAVESLGLTY